MKKIYFPWWLLVVLSLICSGVIYEIGEFVVQTSSSSSQYVSKTRPAEKSESHYAKEAFLRARGVNLVMLGIGSLTWGLLAHFALPINRRYDFGVWLLIILALTFISGFLLILVDIKGISIPDHKGVYGTNKIGYLMLIWEVISFYIASLLFTVNCAKYSIPPSRWMRKYIPW